MPVKFFVLLNILILGVKLLRIRSVSEKLDLWNQLTGGTITIDQWADWKWQAKNCLTQVTDILKYLALDSREFQGSIEAGHKFLTSVTPSHLMLIKSLIDSDDRKELVAANQLMNVFMPRLEELRLVAQNTNDGLGEEDTTDISCVSQLYNDRALLFVTDNCPLYCRYCFRRRKVIHDLDSRTHPEILLSDEHFESAMHYIEKTSSVRDVVLSGGDPLFLTDDKLEKILTRLRKIDHVDIIRIDTKVISALPQRITASLLQMLNKFQPLFITIHSVHPFELADGEVRNSIKMLADSGFSLGTYTPLLAGVNDNRNLLKTLFWELLQLRVRPYYLVHFVPTTWTEHFRLSLEKSLRLYSGLHSEISGLALPTFVIYIPKKGKVLLSSAITGPHKDGDRHIYTITNLFSDHKEIYYEPVITTHPLEFTLKKL